ncbi:MAG: sporulation stage III protein AG [Tissierellia bacterium]|nr:sporulation stage III protein AG [Tissierellia bacterium]
MGEILNKIKKHIEDMGNKKFINNLFIILIGSIILLIGVSFFTKEDKKTELPTRIGEEKAPSKYDYNEYLEYELANILGKLKGVGEVNVMITLEDSIESIPASNTNKIIETTKEIDSEGGSREVNREDINVQMLSNDDNSLVVIKSINPTVKGAIVVAEGAEDLAVLENIYEAVKTVLGISGNKVQVYSSK